MNRGMRIGALVAAVALAAGRGSGWAAPGVAVGSQARALIESPDGAVRVEAPDGSSQSLALPGNVELRRVESLARGWVGLGTQAVPGRRDLFLLDSDLAQAAELPPPPGLVEERYAAVPLIDQGELVGVAWIEGDAQASTSVRAAAWDGAAWGEPEVVSPTTGFAQLAVSAAVLDDGSWLLVWAAVDGHDDEILWSRRENGEWSAPERVHEDNAQPDILPAVAAVEGGAIVAWSWFDGADYRMRTARFDGTTWALDPPFGAKGSLAAGFERGASGLRLLYSAVRPAQWEVLELDQRGAPRRRGVVPRVVEGRPQIIATAQGGTMVRFPALEAWEQPVTAPITWNEEP
jgi:hypothetical protein